MLIFFMYRETTSLKQLKNAFFLNIHIFVDMCKKRFSKWFDMSQWIIVSTHIFFITVKMSNRLLIWRKVQQKHIVYSQKLILNMLQRLEYVSSDLHDLKVVILTQKIKSDQVHLYTRDLSDKLTNQSKWNKGSTSNVYFKAWEMSTTHFKFDPNPTVWRDEISRNPSG